MGLGFVRSPMAIAMRVHFKTTTDRAMACSPLPMACAVRGSFATTSSTALASAPFRVGIAMKASFGTADKTAKAPTFFQTGLALKASGETVAIPAIARRANRRHRVFLVRALNSRLAGTMRFQSQSIGRLPEPSQTVLLSGNTILGKYFAFL